MGFRVSDMGLHVVMVRVLGDQAVLKFVHAMRVQPN